jgi:hypothetical protein
VIEAAALWGFATGAAAGGLTGLAASFAGGPLGDGRLAAVGPSGWQVGLVAMLEVGVTAALSAAAANWLMLRRANRRRVTKRRITGSWTEDQLVPPQDAAHAGREAVAFDALPGIPAGIIDENDDAGGHRIYLNPWADLDRRDDLEGQDDE